MRVITVVALAATLLVGGCASSIMEGFVGQPLQVGIARYGPPAFVFDMPDGRRAFQWRMESQVAMPTTTYGNVNTNIYAPPGSFASANTQYSQTTYGGNVLNQVCLYTMYARFNESQQAWIFEGFEKPSLACQ